MPPKPEAKPTKPESKAKKTCPEKEILDETTNRCVSLTGKRGTEIVSKYVTDNVARKPYMKKAHILLPYLKLNLEARVSFVNPKTNDELMMKYSKKAKAYKLIHFPKGDAKKKQVLGSFPSHDHLVYDMLANKRIQSSFDILMSTSKEGAAIIL